jgi:hypothetical protein
LLKYSFVLLDVKKGTSSLGGPKFLLGRCRILGPKGPGGCPIRIFSHKLEDSRLLDIAPTKLGPTWRNKRMGEEHIAKRLDHFLISTHLVEVLLLLRQWVGSRGKSDHYPIFLEVAGNTRKLESHLNSILLG